MSSDNPVQFAFFMLKRLRKCTCFVIAAVLVSMTIGLCCVCDWVNHRCLHVPPHIFQLLCGVDVTDQLPPHSMLVLCLRPRQSLLPQVQIYPVHPHSLRSSPASPPLHINSHHSFPTHSSSILMTCPYHFNLLFVTFRCIFLPLSLSL